MLSRLRSTLLAWGAALVLVVSASGMVAAAALVGDTAPADGTLAAPTVTDTSATFEDLNGDGIDDDCQDAVVADQAAADAALTAADANADGTMSVSEAAHTDWVGGANCNHGGYVSTVAQDSDEGDDSTAEDDAAPAAECEATTPEAPVTTSDEQAPEDASPNAHGKAVATVAQDPAAIGGKNCNHGGAVSEAAKKDHGSDVHGNSAKHAGAKSKEPKGHRWGHGKP